MLEKLTIEEQIKLRDFMTIYRNYLNPTSDKEIDKIIDYILDTVVKVYIEYKDVIPFIPVRDDNYSYYILKPMNGKYSLLDYLINTMIQNLDSIEFSEDKSGINYNMLKKKIYINKKYVTSLHESVFDTCRKEIDKESFLALYYKHFCYHEIGHMLHYKINNIEDNTVYVPVDYLSLNEASTPNRKRLFSNRKKELEKRKVEARTRAMEKIKKRISMYSGLKDRYNILSPEEINDCSVKVERNNIKLEEIMIPPFLYSNPVEEAFTDCDAQVYSGIFENQIFEANSTGELECFYLPIDDEHVLMTYCPTGYSFSASIGFALKESISKQAYFRTIFLGKSDLFLEFLGSYDQFSAMQFSHELINADKGKMPEVQPLLDDIVEFRTNNGLSLKPLNIYFPLIYKDNKWVYYLDGIDKVPSQKTLKKNI